MNQNKRIDAANEPVETQDDGSFMDTGVLHEKECAQHPGVHISAGGTCSMCGGDQ